MKLSKQKAIFRRVFKQEFMRELTFLWDILAGRSTERADFTDGLVDLAKQSASAAASLCPIPGIAEVLANALNFKLDIWNDDRKSSARDAVLTAVLDVDETALEILLDTVALELVCRYENFLETRLSGGLSGILPLAQTAVARILSFIVSRKLPMSEETLLMGVVTGLSGAGASGFWNTELPVKQAKNTLKQKLTRRTGYTAEGLFGRSGFLTPDQSLWVLEDEKQAYHRVHSTGKKFNHFSSNYGYTKLQDDQQPKYVASVSAAEKNRWYGHVKNLAGKKFQFVGTQQELVRIDREMLEDFLTKQAEKASLSLLDYMKTLGFQSACLVIFSPSSSEELDLTDCDFSGVNLSDSVFNHCQFSGSLEQTRFDRSYLRNANFQQVCDASGASFREAHCEHLSAINVNLSDADFTQSSLRYASLENAILKNCQLLGVDWAHSKTNGMITNESQAIVFKQKQQHIKGGDVVTKQYGAPAILSEKLPEDHRLVGIEQELLQVEQQHRAFIRWSQQMEVELKADSDRKQQTLLDEQAKALAAFREEMEGLIKQAVPPKIKRKYFPKKSTVRPMASDSDEKINALEKNFDELISKNRQAMTEIQEQLDKLEIAMEEAQAKLESHDTQLANHDDQLFVVKEQLIKLSTDKTRELEEQEKSFDQQTQFLKNRYLAKNSIQGLFGEPLELEGQYINVQMLLKGEAEVHDMKNCAEVLESEGASEGVSSFNGLFGNKTPVQLRQLFLPNNEFFNLQRKEKNSEKKEESNTKETPNLVLIQGQAGIGKTTFVEFTTREWAAGRLWHEYKLIFVLRLRDLREGKFLRAQELGETYTLSEWVYHTWYAGRLQESDFRLFWEKRVKKHANTCLFVLDGYDELPTGHPCEDALRELVHGSWEAEPAGYKVLITSRPYGIDELPMDRRNLEIVGFVDRNVSQYVKFYYGEEHITFAEHVLRALRGNPLLWGSAHVPVTLNIICGVIEARAKQSGLDQALASLNTLTSLYEVMESALLERAYLNTPMLSSFLDECEVDEKTEIIKKHYEQTCDFLKALAFEAFNSDQLVLPANVLIKQFRAANIPAESRKALKEQMLSLGLLKPILDEGSIKLIGYEFLHLTFQEYYAAQHIATLLKANPLESQAIQNLTNFRAEPRYQIIWWFVSGLLKSEQEAWIRLMRFISDGQIAGDEDIRTLKEDAFELGEDHAWAAPEAAHSTEYYRLGLQLRCVEEALALAKATKLADKIQKAVGTQVLACFNSATSQDESKSFALSNFTSADLELLRNLPRPKGGWLEEVYIKIQSVEIDNEEYKQTLFADEIDFLSTWLTENGLEKLSVKLLTPVNSLIQAINPLIQAIRMSPECSRSVELNAKLVTVLPTFDLDQFILTPDCEKTFLQSIKFCHDFGLSSEVIIDRMLSYMQHPHHRVRQNAAEAIGKLAKGGATHQMLSTLVAYLKDSKQPLLTRTSAYQALAALGESAATTEVLKTLEFFLSDYAAEQEFESSLCREKMTFILPICKTIKALGQAACTEEMLTRLITCIDLHYSPGDEELCDLVSELADIIDETPPTNTTLLIKIANHLDAQNLNPLRELTYQAIGVISRSTASETASNEIRAFLQNKTSLEAIITRRALDGLTKTEEIMLHEVLLPMGSNTKLIDCFCELHSIQQRFITIKERKDEDEEANIEVHLEETLGQINNIFVAHFNKQRDDSRYRQESLQMVEQELEDTIQQCSCHLEVVIDRLRETEDEIEAARKLQENQAGSSSSADRSLERTIELSKLEAIRRDQEESVREVYREKDAFLLLAEATNSKINEIELHIESTQRKLEEVLCKGESHTLEMCSAIFSCPERPDPALKTMLIVALEARLQNCSGTETHYDNTSATYSNTLLSVARTIGSLGSTVITQGVLEKLMHILLTNEDDQGDLKETFDEQCVEPYQEDVGIIRASQFAAAQAIGHLGQTAATALLESLIGYLNDESSSTRRAALRAIQALAKSAATKELMIKLGYRLQIADSNECEAILSVLPTLLPTSSQVFLTEECSLLRRFAVLATYLTPNSQLSVNWDDEQKIYILIITQNEVENNLPINEEQAQFLQYIIPVVSIYIEHRELTADFLQHLLEDKQPTPSKAPLLLEQHGNQEEAPQTLHSSVTHTPGTMFAHLKSYTETDERPPKKTSCCIMS